jgi:hypothetical protein
MFQQLIYRTAIVFPLRSSAGEKETARMFSRRSKETPEIGK